jgi:hypothetical protein
MNQSQLKVLKRILDFKVKDLIKKHAPYYDSPATEEERLLQVQIKELEARAREMSRDRRERHARIREQIQKQADMIELQLVTQDSGLAVAAQQLIERFSEWTPEEADAQD